MHKHALVGFVTLLLVANVQAQDATKQDLDQAESRLAATIENATAGLEQLSDLANQTNDINETVAAINEWANRTGQEILGVLYEMQAAIEASRNETLQDHLDIYKALLGPDNKPALQSLLAVAAANGADIQEAQAHLEALQTMGFRIRGDLDNQTVAMTVGFNNINDANEQVYKAADGTYGIVRFALFLIVIMVFSNALLLSYHLQKPAAIWKRFRRAKAQVDSAVGHGDPVCPAENQGLEFGGYYQCPVRDECPHNEDCQKRARNLTEADITATDTYLDDEQATIAPDEPEERYEEPGPAPRTGGFGGF